MIIKPNRPSKARIFIAKGKLEVKQTPNRGPQPVHRKPHTAEIHDSLSGRDLVVQRDVIDTEQRDFWGIDSARKLYERLISHVALSALKSKELNCKTISRISSIEEFQQLFKSGKIRNMLDKFDAIRLTFRGGDFTFTFNGQECNHTIGLVPDRKHGTIYLLDSLGDDGKDLKRFHNLIVDALKNDLKSPNFDKIIYNREVQQGDFDLTCSNWTWADIETVQKRIKKGGYIPNSNVLDSILPKNVNQILRDQHQYILEHLDILEERFKGLM